MPFSRQPVWIYALLAGLAVLVLMFGILMLTGTRDSAPIVRSSGQAQIGGPFTLVNQDGETVTDEDFRGKAMLIYFGFTYCPDICPFSLQTMDAALAQLDEAERALVQPILISVDPRRDTPEALAAYVQSDAFPDGLIGLTGTPEQVAQVAGEYRVIYRETEEGQEDESYLVDHTSFIYLMDFEGEFVTVFSHGHTPQAIADALQDFLDQERSS
ncbi:SCO family protein [Hyphobacterium sp. SN044]|uniref:SCO family protein n=1 Tax=Hyphobacterium sp. SN044 TaxID=2912575 RepID=UPI001F29BA7B|nr:SCO family protein [Hyphobacterium sp. SN044]MCF8880973.1 SCO family protein [Hyphobacterium sp. SN044]